MCTAVQASAQLLQQRNEAKLQQTEAEHQRVLLRDELSALKARAADNCHQPLPGPNAHRCCSQRLLGITSRSFCAEVQRRQLVFCRMWLDAPYAQITGGNTLPMQQGQIAHLVQQACRWK